MHKYRRTPKIGEHWISALLEWEYAVPSVCHVKFVSYATKGVRISRRETPKFGTPGTSSSLGVGVANP